MKKIPFGDVRYTDTHQDLQKYISEAKEKERAALQQLPMEVVSYQDVFLNDAAKTKADAQRMLDLTNTFDPTKYKNETRAKVRFCGMFSYRSKVDFPLVDGWVLLHCQTNTTQIRLTSAQANTQAAQVDIWLDVWDIPQNALKNAYEQHRNTADFKFVYFLRDIAWHQIIADKYCDTDDNTKPSTEKYDDAQQAQHKEAQTTDHQAPAHKPNDTSDHQAPTNYKPLLQNNDPLFPVIENLKQRLYTIGKDYTDVIKALRNKYVKLHALYPKVKPEKRKELLQTRTNHFKRDIKDIVNPFLNHHNIYNAQRKLIEKDLYTQLWGEKLSHYLTKPQQNT